MDLKKLPDEMLFNVLKNTDFISGRKLRKINTRIDSLAKRANIHTTVPVQNFIINEDDIIIEFNDFTSNKSITKKFQYESVDSIEKWLSLTAIKRLFWISGDWDAIRFDQPMFSVLKKCRRSFQETKALRFVAVEFALPKECMVEFIQKYCPNAKELALQKPSGMIENLFNVEVLGNRDWDCFMNLHACEAIIMDDEFILKVVARSKRCHLGRTKTSFTINGVINLIKKLSIDRIQSQEISLYKVELGNLALSTVARSLATALPGVEVQYEDSFDENKVRIRCYSIEFGNQSYRSHVSFKLDIALQ